MNIEELKSILTGKTVVVGVGNEQRGDDGVGPLVARLLRRFGLGRVINSGPSPENETWRIRELMPDNVLFIDAVDFGGLPGDFAVLTASDLRAQGYDTHRMPLKLTMEYLESELRCKCFALAIQPRVVSQGTPMSNEVRRSAFSVARMLRENILALQRLG